MKKRKLNKYGMIALAVIAMIIILIFLSIIDKIRYEINESNSSEVYTLKINDQIIKPNYIVSKKNYIFNHGNKKYFDISVPKDSKINLNKDYKIKDENGKKVTGDINYLKDGKYKLVVKEQSYSYTYYLNVDNDFTVQIDETKSKQGGYVVASFVDLNDDEVVKIKPKFKSSDKFYFDKDKTVIPIDYNNDVGSYNIDFSTALSKESATINVGEMPHDDIHITWTNYEKKEEENTDEHKKFIEASSKISDKKLYSKFQKPALGKINAGFGDQYYINGDTKPTVVNLALDISNVINSEISATADGEVLYTGEFETYGKVIVIDHGHGIVSTYSHLNEINVTPGEKVSAGAIIGKMGDTGNVNGVNLNFEIHINGIKVDPNIFLYEELNI